MDAFKIVEKISGNSATVVYKAKRSTNDENVSIKKIPINLETGVSLEVIREIKALKRLRSSYIVELYECFAEENNVCMVLEYFPFTLRSLIDMKFVFSIDAFDSIAFQLCKAVEFIHKNGMIHRDLNSAQVLLDSKCNVKLAGLGHSRYESKSMTNQITSLHYQAPEILLGDTKYSAKVDSWSIACILIEMKTGEPPFRGTDEISQCKLIFKTLGTPECDYPWNDLFRIQQYETQDNVEHTIQNKFGNLFDERMFQIVREFLQTNKSKRLSVTNALRLPVLRKGTPLECSIEPLNSQI